MSEFKVNYETQDIDNLDFNLNLTKENSKNQQVLGFVKECIKDMYILIEENIPDEKDLKEYSVQIMDSVKEGISKLLKTDQELLKLNVNETFEKFLNEKSEDAYVKETSLGILSIMTSNILTYNLIENEELLMNLESRERYIRFKNFNK